MASVYTECLHKSAHQSVMHFGAYWQDHQYANLLILLVSDLLLVQ